MSLINDALKRAKQAQQKNAPPPATGTPMRPVESARPVNPPRSLLLPILAAALLVFVGGILIVVALSRGFRVKPAESVASQSAVVSKDDPGNAARLPRTAGVPPVTSISTSTTASQLVPTNPPQFTAAAVSSVVTQAVVTVESSNAAPVMQVPPEPQLPKLQGIVFNPARPTAFLNGKSVVVGARVAQYTVLAITKQAVIVERAGQTNVLTMEE